jgi:hypothetical protein
MRKLIVAAAILMLACPGNRTAEDESKAGPAKTSTTASNPQAVPEKSTPAINPPVKTAAATPPIQVQLTEYEIQMPDSIPAGASAFQIVNGGTMNHSLAIEGNGVSEKLGADLTRGDSTLFAIALKPGTYTVYCPVDKHRGKGMQRALTVR